MSIIFFPKTWEREIRVALLLCLACFYAKLRMCTCVILSAKLPVLYLITFSSKLSLGYKLLSILLNGERVLMLPTRLAGT